MHHIKLSASVNVCVCVCFSAFPVFHSQAGEGSVINAGKQGSVMFLCGLELLFYRVEMQSENSERCKMDK